MLSTRGRRQNLVRDQEKQAGERGSLPPTPACLFTHKFTSPLFISLHLFSPIPVPLTNSLHFLLFHLYVSSQPHSPLSPPCLSWVLPFIVSPLKLYHSLWVSSISALPFSPLLFIPSLLFSPLLTSAFPLKVRSSTPSP